MSGVTGQSARSSHTALLAGMGFALLTACGSPPPELSDAQKFEGAKRCTDAAMIPFVGDYSVICRSPVSGAER